MTTSIFLLFGQSAASYVKIHDIIFRKHDIHVICIVQKIKLKCHETWQKRKLATYNRPLLQEHLRVAHLELLRFKSGPTDLRPKLPRLRLGAVGRREGAPTTRSPLDKGAEALVNLRVAHSKRVRLSPNANNLSERASEFVFAVHSVGIIVSTSPQIVSRNHPHHVSAAGMLDAAVSSHSIVSEQDSAVLQPFYCQ